MVTDLPIFCVVDTRPVKVVEDDEGDPVVLAWDAETGEFECRMDLLDRVVLQDDWVIELTEEEFEEQLSSSRASIAVRPAHACATAARSNL